MRAFGEGVFELIEQEPKRLHEVAGIGPKRAGRIVAGWAEQKVVREIMLFLHAHGVGTSRAVRIFKTSGQDFYPLLVSTRSPEDIDKPTATHVLQDDASLLAYVRNGQDLTHFGVVIGETCEKDPSFSEQNAIAIATRSRTWDG